MLPAEEREAFLGKRVRRDTLRKLAPRAAPGADPLGPELSSAVLAASAATTDAGHAVRVLRDTLPAALHPGTLPAVERRCAAGDDAYLRTTLRDVLQFQSLHRSISEAFR